MISQVPNKAQIERFLPVFAGQACVVVGSATLTTPYAQILPGEFVVAVNGSISSVPPEVVPDLWLLNSKADKRGWTTQLRVLHGQMLAQGRDRAVNHVALLRGPKYETEWITLEQLRAMRCTYQSWSLIDKPIKFWLEQEVCDRKHEKAPCSAGMFAVALALWCGAASVRLVGFSWHVGYHYLPNVDLPAQWRGHVDADKKALAALQRDFPGQVSGALVEAA